MCAYLLLLRLLRRKRRLVANDQYIDIRKTTKKFIVGNDNKTLRTGCVLCEPNGGCAYATPPATFVERTESSANSDRIAPYLRDVQTSAAAANDLRQRRNDDNNKHTHIA
jgi:hypothetical protein